MTFKNSQYTIKVSVIISFFCQVGIGKGGIFLIERMHISLDRVIVVGENIQRTNGQLYGQGAVIG